MIKAEIIADSTNWTGKRLTTFKLTFPRIILAEFNTHRMFSRNSASSRAIPFEKMVESVKNNPFIPIAWQKDHKGMQGTEYFTEELYINIQRDNWLKARDYATQQANYMNKSGVTKQLCNRLLEPFTWHTVIMTTEEEGLQNFFDLRCPNYQVYENVGKTNENAQILSFKSKKDAIRKCPDLYDITDTEWLLINKGQAEIHIMALAEAMWDAYNESEPKFLKPGEWHIPFEKEIKQEAMWNAMEDAALLGLRKLPVKPSDIECQISVAKCARVSYTVVGEENSTDYLKDLKLFDKLLESRHLSPFEHIAKVPTTEDLKYKLSEGWMFDMQTGENIFESDLYVSNFKGWIQYRKIVENE